MASSGLGWQRPPGTAPPRRVGESHRAVGKRASRQRQDIARTLPGHCQDIARTLPSGETLPRQQKDSSGAGDGPMTPPQAVQQYAQHHAQQAQPTAHAQPHGKKRAADTTLESEQRLSKRFDLLNLGNYSPPSPLLSPPAFSHAAVDTNGTRLYIPVPGSHDAAPAPNASPSRPKPLPPVPQKKRSTRPPHFPPSAKPPRSPVLRPISPDMHIDDTPHRIYIHDLAAELSDLSSDEETPIFLPDIEKHLAKIPRHVLMGEEELKATRDNQLVVYGVPSSLTVPEEQDRVRRAIAEARERIRARGVGGMEGGSRGSTAGGDPGRRTERPPEVPSMDTGHEYEDGDAMDID
ncbi:hypothetical protein P154DRAFT_578901 [Amniculicola lignicola CBS 123094]|uniref:Uncharacterized protein n=1 Tax=Amniculicola lignicola CBS 123094 TaxID=1392246 RepID=A0A6A5W9E2_9PLEO|nr:hypothetical protein P154DRAFT_578901 [Amniculicola lignicola CBS 123094]